MAIPSPFVVHLHLNDYSALTMFLLDYLLQTADVAFHCLVQYTAGINSTCPAIEIQMTLIAGLHLQHLFILQHSCSTRHLCRLVAVTVYSRWHCCIDLQCRVIVGSNYASVLCTIHQSFPSLHWSCSHA